MARETKTSKELPEGVVMVAHNNTSKKIQCVYDWQGLLKKIPPGETLKIAQWDEKYIQKRRNETLNNPFVGAIE